MYVRDADFLKTLAVFIDRIDSLSCDVNDAELTGLAVKESMWCWHQSLDIVYIDSF